MKLNHPRTGSGNPRRKRAITMCARSTLDPVGPAPEGLLARAESAGGLPVVCQCLPAPCLPCLPANLLGPMSSRPSTPRYRPDHVAAGSWHMATVESIPFPEHTPWLSPEARSSPSLGLYAPLGLGYIMRRASSGRVWPDLPRPWAVSIASSSPSHPPPAHLCPFLALG